MTKVLVTTDFSSNSKAGIKFALQLQTQTKCDLVFYHVVEIMKPTSWNDLRYKRFSQQKIAEFTEALIDFISKVKGEGFKAKGTIAYKVEIGTAIDQMVIKAAKKHKADFICMATQGAGRIKKIFGTNASAMINNSPTPVIIVPSGYLAKPITTIFYASDFAKLATELKLVQKFAEALKAKTNVYHFDYLLHVAENRTKLEKLAKKHLTNNIRFNFRRLEIDIPLSIHLKKEITKVKPGIVVLFTKQNRQWFDRLFPSSESQEMAFNSKVPLLIFRKKT